MKKVTLILALALLVFQLTNCGGDKTTSETPRNLLKYTVNKEDVSDTPIKTQITLDIIIDDKDSITKENLKQLLLYLFNQQISRTGFQYHDNPNTVLIYASSSKELANSGMGQWIAMISKMYDDTEPNYELNETQFNALSIIETEKWGLSQKIRVEIWDKIIYAEQYAQVEADKKYPLDKPGITDKDMSNNVNLMRKLNEKKEQKIAREYNISENIIDSIGLEGISKGWAFPK